MNAMSTASATATSAASSAEENRVFDAAAQLFTVLSTPIRLKILSALCDGEMSVSQLLQKVGSSQPNVSQHLTVMQRAGVLAKRKEGTLVIYRIDSERAKNVCRSVVVQIAMEQEETAC